MSSDYSFDLFNPDETQNMWGLMEEMRSKCPVASPAPGMYYTARFEETERVFKDGKRFSCEGGFRAPGVDIPPDERLMAEIDPPVHPKLRRFLLRSFNPGMALKAEPFTREYVRSLFDAIDAKGGGNLVAEFATSVPVAVTGHVLGVPREDIPRVGPMLFDLLHTDWPAYGVLDRSEPDEGIGIAGSAPELAAYFDDMIARRRSGEVVSDDLTSQMIEAEVDGERLSDERIRSLMVNFLTAGLSTTNLIGNMIYRLMTDEALDATLRRSPELVAPAIEESLRFDPPVLFLFRTAKEETTLADVTVDKGDRIAMGIASANRDAAVYQDPDEFRINPDDPEHLAFGAGAHLCLGNHMARMEGRVAVEEYLDRYPFGRMSLAPGYELHLMPHFLEYGPEALDVVVAP
jgi:cytochrome P450